MFGFLRQKAPALHIRTWESRDVPSIRIMECQYAKENGEPDPVDSETLYQWIRQDSMRGIVITENGRPKGYAAFFIPKIQRVMIRALRVDKDRRRHGYGTLLLNRIFNDCHAWNKACVEIDISERNEGARLFLMKPDKSGFAITTLSEFTDTDGFYDEAFYQMQCPAPAGFKPKDIRFLVNGEEKQKRP